MVSINHAILQTSILVAYGVAKKVTRIVMLAVHDELFGPHNYFLKCSYVFYIGT